MAAVHEAALDQEVHVVYWQLLVLDTVQLVAAVHVPVSDVVGVQLVASPTV